MGAIVHSIRDEDRVNCAANEKHERNIFKSVIEIIAYNIAEQEEFYRKLTAKM